MQHENWIIFSGPYNHSEAYKPVVGALPMNIRNEFSFTDSETTVRQGYFE